MSTLIVVGRVVRNCVFDTRSQKTVENATEIGIHQQGAMTIKVERVLYSSESEAPFYPLEKHGTTVEAVYGSPGLDISPADGTSKIFFLTRDGDRNEATRPYRYPFYDWTNLTIPDEQESEVIRIIAAFNAVK